jgi:hypothetical protein
MINVSLNQVLTLWDELIACKYKCNTYGTDVCEIYIYTAMEHSSTFAQNPKSTFCADQVLEANANIHTICRMFEKRHNCVVEFESGDSIDLLLDVNNPFTWRIHLRVKEPT